MHKNNKLIQENLKNIIVDVLSANKNYIVSEYGNYTISFIEFLFKQENEKKKKEKLIGIFCHKIDVTKKIFYSYDKSWKNSINKILLGVDVWPALIAILILESFKEEKCRGLKYINTSFNGISLYKSLGGTIYSEKLYCLATKRLKSLL